VANGFLTHSDSKTSTSLKHKIVSARHRSSDAKFVVASVSLLG
jgi:hypothetical protein